jgi:hypothetical protein
MFGYLGRAWRGEERLLRVALPIGVLGNAIAFCLIAFGQLIAAKHGIYGDTYIGVGAGGHKYIGVKHEMSNAFGLEFLTWLPFSLVCIWRCAPNVTTPKYQTWTRQLVVMCVVFATLWYLLGVIVESE